VCKQTKFNKKEQIEISKQSDLNEILKTNSDHIFTVTNIPKIQWGNFTKLKNIICEKYVTKKQETEI
jgi:hypothetical protein